jgi:methylated-DNA-[protein]-cysteine S-methyltransferase
MSAQRMARPGKAGGEAAGKPAGKAFGAEGPEGPQGTHGMQGPERTERVSAPPLGLELLWRGGRLAGLRLTRAEASHLEPDASPEARALHAALLRLGQHRPADFPPLPLAWELVPPFTRQVLETLLARVGHGQRVTYGELARLAGHPGKARAVGQAMARNPWPLIVPCHRVLGAGGCLTGYTNPHGLPLKELLLQMESGPARD